MIHSERFGCLADGREVTLFRIENVSGAFVELLDYGATLQSVFVPDKEGKLADVTVGFADLHDMQTRSSGQGNTIGRYANRIANGAFSLDGVRYEVTKNEKDRTCLHGGGEFAAALWSAQAESDDAVLFRYTSPEGAMGFPGSVRTQVRYTFTPNNTLRIDFYALTDKKTVLNLTNHAYFNLSGVAGSDILGHTLQICADYFTPTDEWSIPTGELRPVRGTVFDFNQPKQVGRDINTPEQQLLFCGGYDHNFCLRPDASPAAVLFDPASGRQMQLFTDLPGVQLYTGNFLSGEPGKNGGAQVRRAGLCLETQFYPDSPNKPDFPSCVFGAGEAFAGTTRFQFSVRK